jgi:hypothetical protein
MPDSRPDLDAPFAIFGVPATVTPVGGPAVECTVIEEAPLAGRLALEADPQVENTSPRWSLRRDDVATLPIDSIILAARKGEDAQAWRVIRVDSLDPEVLTAVVA